MQTPLQTGTDLPDNPATEKYTRLKKLDSVKQIPSLTAPQILASNARNSGPNSPQRLCVKIRLQSP